MGCHPFLSLESCQHFCSIHMSLIEAPEKYDAGSTGTPYGDPLGPVRDDNHQGHHCSSSKHACCYKEDGQQVLICRISILKQEWRLHWHWSIPFLHHACQKLFDRLWSSNPYRSVRHYGPWGRLWYKDIISFFFLSRILNNWANKWRVFHNKHWYWEPSLRIASSEKLLSRKQVRRTHSPDWLIQLSRWCKSTKEDFHIRPTNTWKLSDFTKQFELHTGVLE